MRTFYRDEIKADSTSTAKKGKLNEVTYDNFEDICEEKQGFCLITFLPSITSIDYEKDSHEKNMEIIS
jgi:hypothetical protein